MRQIQNDAEKSSDTPTVYMSQPWSLCTGHTGADQTAAEKASSNVSYHRLFLRVSQPLSVLEECLRGLRGFVKDWVESFGVAIEKVLLSVTVSSNLFGERLRTERRFVEAALRSPVDQLPFRTQLVSAERPDLECVLLNVVE